MRYPRPFAATTLAAVGALLLAACSSGGNAADATSEGATDPGTATTSEAAPTDASPVTLTLATFLDPAGTTGREKVLKKLIDGFQADNPNVTIEVQTSQFSLLGTQFLAGAAAGNAPDISFVTNLDVLKVNSLGYFADLSSAFGADDLADLESGSWNGVLVDGAPHAVPLFPISFGYLYNTEMFAAADIDPASITTWDAFDEAATTLAATGVGGFCQGFSESTPDQTGVTARLLSAAGTLFNDDGTPNWDSQDGIDAVNWAKGLIDAGATPAEAVAWTTEDPYEQFAAGNCAMAMSASSRIPTIQGQIGEDKVGFALFPTVDGSAPTVNLLGGWTAGAWTGGKHVDLATKFLAYLVSADADQLWVQEAGQAPLRQSTGDALDLPDWLQTVVTGIGIGYAPPADMKGDWRPAFNAIMQDVLVNGTDTETALKNGIDRYLNG